MLLELLVPWKAELPGATPCIGLFENSFWQAIHAKNATAAWNLPIPSTKILG